MFKNKDFWKNFISALSTIASLATLITFLFDWRADCISSWILIFLSILIGVICFIYGWWMIRRKNKIEIKFHSSFKVTITFGDLLNSQNKGIVVIPVNQYFDTQLAGSLVSSDSILGTFITKCWLDRVDELDRKIDDALSYVAGVPDNGRKVGKKTKYNLGTCADIRDGENTYVLVVTIEKNSKGKSILSKKDYPVVIGSLFEHLATIKPQREIFMPVFGAGRGRMRRSLQRILSFLLDTIDFKYSDLTFPCGVNIIVKEAYKNEVNLNEIEHHFEKALKD